jgi:hypothetical protein
MRIGETRKGWTLKYTAYAPILPSENNPLAPIFDHRFKRWVSLPPRVHEHNQGMIYTTIAGVAKPVGMGVVLKDRGHVKVSVGTYRDRGTY